MEIVPPGGGGGGGGTSVGDNDRKKAEQSSTWEIIGRSRGTTRGSQIGIGVAKSRLSS